MERLRSLRARVCRDEGGFTLVEVLFAAGLCLVAIMAVISTLDYSRELVTHSERRELAVHRAEQEMERVLAVPFNTVALNSTPEHSPNENDPAFYYNGGNYQWDQGPTGPRSDSVVVDLATGALEAKTAWNDGRGRTAGWVHRYVTEVADPCCPTGPKAKRVTVAVTVEDSGADAPRAPVLLSTIVTPKS